MPNRPGGFLHAAVAQALQDGIHLAVCYTIPDAAFGLLMAELFQNAVHGIICTFAWHVVLPFGMGFLFFAQPLLAALHDVVHQNTGGHADVITVHTGFSTGHIPAGLLLCRSRAACRKLSLK